MESRLIPINAVISLATPDGINPAVFADHGYRVAGLEVPLGAQGQSVVADLIVANGDTGHILVFESKCGANIEEAQCARYATLSAANVIRTAHIDLRRRVTPVVEVVYACLGQHSDRIRLGLDTVGVAFPILAVHDRKVALEGGTSDGPLMEMFHPPVILKAPPARLIPFDAESSIEIVEPYVRTALVAALSQGISDISMTALTERSVRHFSLFGHKAQNTLKKRVGEAARRIATQVPATFEYHGPRENRDGWVVLLRSPESHDPRGRTQAYQALARLGRSRRSPKKSAIIAGQTNLLDELDKADEGERDSREDQAEETP
ncbi:hypothetical protein [Streptosporangium sandarakinum]|uniref:hypothetical protein n=1 Tax=Streptosporangium sandarakinum TaxID=1260955 RepID=UPI00379C1AC6